MRQILAAVKNGHERSKLRSTFTGIPEVQKDIRDLTRKDLKSQTQ